MKMISTITTWLALMTAFLFVSPVVIAAPGDGIMGTSHDFSGVASPATGVCTFCHTPHKAQSQALLWNHDLSTNTFSWTDPTTTAGTEYPTIVGDQYKGVSVKCLSCHDGSVAVGDVGWWNAGEPAAPLLNFFIPPNSPGSMGNAGNMFGNHPVAMPFPWNNAPSTYNGKTTGDGIILGDWKSDPQTLGIRLFNDDGSGNTSAGAVAGQTGIECSSCHDPHNGSGVEDVFFLRGTLGGSDVPYICLKCHTK
ncbi:MAG: cytochrome c3 family protein [Gammaproteobacteria bacterium]|nr:cytochrome c3 family protein [Gammaproteobacteria bacterium]MDH3769262.1 cytochrome c3 family protein [Gammaproteobacteria bacterium]